MSNRLWMPIVAALGCVAAMTSMPAAAHTDIAVRIGVPAPVYVAPPPAPVYEVQPAPRRGHVWVPGHWAWRGERQVWRAGSFVPARGYEQAQWVRHGGSWGYRDGAWRGGDRDHDGIPNRWDRDRDGDGVPNRYDRAPDNRRRY